MSDALVYYFGFPHYRREILGALRQLQEPSFEFISGQTSRANIATLSEGDVEGLTTVRSIRVGPVSWDRGVVRRAAGARYSTVILGPATLSLSTWAVLVARRIRGRRTFLWGQCGRFGDRSLKRRIQELMNRLATGVLVYGENEAVAATQMGLDASRVSVVNNATSSNADQLRANDSDEVLDRAKRAAMIANETGDLRLLFVGRLNGDKRLEVLLAAAEALRPRFPRLVVDLVGDGDARESLRERFPGEWVRFHGWIYDDEKLRGLFQSTTLVCSPYHMGLLAIDALRAGTPVLVPNNPLNGSEVEALTPAVNSVRFDPGSEESLVEAVATWFSVVETLDSEVYRQARESALSTWDPPGVANAISRAIAE